MEREGLNDDFAIFPQFVLIFLGDSSKIKKEYKIWQVKKSAKI